MTRPVARAAALVALPLAVAAAQQAAAAPAAPAVAVQQPAVRTPNFSGTWEINVAQSTFGPQGAPSRMTLKIEQSGDRVSTTTTSTTAEAGEQTAANAMTIGGPASTSTISMMGQQAQMTTTARWDGAALVTDAKMQGGGMEVPIVSRWTLSPDGKVLTVDRQITTPSGGIAMHLVFDRKG